MAKLELSLTASGNEYHSTYIFHIKSPMALLAVQSELKGLILPPGTERYTFCGKGSRQLERALRLFDKMKELRSEQTRLTRDKV